MSKGLTDFIARVRKGKRGKPLEGVKVFDLDVVACPTWDEKERLEGKGVLPIHVDELEAFANSNLAPDSKGSKRTNGKERDSHPRS